MLFHATYHKGTVPVYFVSSQCIFILVSVMGKSKITLLTVPVLFFVILHFQLHHTTYCEHTLCSYQKAPMLQKVTSGLFSVPLKF